MADDFRYVPSFNRSRTPAHRRRQWSRYHMVVQPNFGGQQHLFRNLPAEYNQQLADITHLLHETLNAIFNDPALIRRFMHSVNVANASPLNAPQYAPVIAAFAAAGDRFDATHVFDHQFSFATEVGGRYHRPHANLNYEVLHDSAFQVNREAFVDVFRERWNATIERSQQFMPFSRDYHIPADRSISVWIQGRGLYGALEYDFKNDPASAGRWSRPNSRASQRRANQPARKELRPLS